jgi:hypothetical protein
MAGMTLWVGTSPETYNVGKVRVRSINVGGNTVTVAENDDIDWSLADTANLYISCPGEAGFRELWGVYPRITEVGGVVTFYEDYDLTYTDPLDDVIPPKANAGPPVCAFLGSGGFVDVEFVGDESFTTEVGAVIQSCTWDFSDGVLQSGGIGNLGTCAVPNVVRFSSPGFRYVSLTVTDNTAQNRTGTVYVPVWIFDDDEPPLSVEVQSQTGNPNWRIIVKAFQTDDSTTDPFYDYSDGALCVLFTVTEYPDESDDIGGFCHRENIRYVGWLDAESLSFDYDSGTANFTVISHDLRLKQLPGFAYTLESDTTPSDWYEVNNLNLDRALHTHLERRTTTNQVCHVERLGEGNTRPISIQPFSDGSLYDQAQEHLLKDAMTTMMTDRQGVLRVRRDPQFMSAADRNTVEVVNNLSAFTAADFLNEIDQSRQHQYELGYVRLGGFAGDTPLLSQAPSSGTDVSAPAQSEAAVYVEGHIVQNQAELNLWAGLWFSKENNGFKAVPVEMIGYWPVFDPAFQEYVKLTITDPLGRNVWAEDRFIVRQVTFKDLVGDGTTRTELILEMEAPILIGDDVTIPPAPPPAPPTPVPVVPIPPIDYPEVVVIHDRAEVYSTPNFDAVNPTWTNITGALNGVIFCVEMDQYDRQGAWAVTGTTNVDADDDAADIGVWRTDDVTIAAPVWNLVFTGAQGKALKPAYVTCDTLAPDPGWGQMRSLVSCAAGECIVAEALWIGLGTEFPAATAMFRVDSAGGAAVANADVGCIGGLTCDGWCHLCGACGASAPAHADARYHQSGAYVCHSTYRGFHQLYPPYYGIPALGCGAFSEYEANYCADGAAGVERNLVPFHPGATGYHGGARSHVYHQGAWWAIAEQNIAATAAGAVYNTADGEITPAGTWGFFTYCNITSHPNHIWWMWGCNVNSNRDQEIFLDGVGTGVYANDAFGAGTHPDFGGRAGHIRAIWDEDDTLVLVRHDEPSAVWQPNKTIVWTYDVTNGLVDKTGNLGDVWKGSGPQAPPAVWGYTYDNVGFTAFGVPLK